MSIRSDEKGFTVLMALLMSIVAISIDALLPALEIIGKHFHLSVLNHTQYAIGFIFIGMSLGQLISGPLSDAWGRKKVLYLGMFFYLVGSLVCLCAQSFDIFLTGRVLQGIGVSGPYISVVSIVRDRYSGREMARVMSFIMTIFIAVPAVAPGLGQTILFLASWRQIFVFYLFYSVAITVWVYFRLEETLPPDARIPFELPNLISGCREVASNRTTTIYLLCMGICFGSFFGYLNCSRQIFQEQFGTGDMFAVYFGVLALILGAASLMNSNYVERYGMRYICIRSFLCILIASFIFLAMHFVFEIQLWMFVAYAGILFFCFGLAFGNLNALAMEPMGHIAGIASAIIVSASSILSMVLGAAIGQLYDGNLIPIVLGFLVFGIMTLALIVFETKTMQPIAAVPQPAPHL